MPQNEFAYTFNFKQLGDQRGKLVAIEGNRSIPFELKRVFYIYGSSGETVRGKHANKNTKMVFICLSGSCKVMVDNSFERKEFFLDNPETGLFVDNDTWKEMKDFSADCILLVLCSTFYDNTEYITDYNEFLNYVKK